MPMRMNLVTVGEQKKSKKKMAEKDLLG